MGRPKQRTMWSTGRNWPSRERLAGFFGISLLFLFSGCAQLDQLLGKEAEAGKSAPPAQVAAPEPSATPKPTAKATEPTSKPLVKKKAEESRPSSVATEPRQQAPSHVPVNPTAPATGLAKQPEPAVNQSEQDKALAEKEQPLKEEIAKVSRRTTTADRGCLPSSRPASIQTRCDRWIRRLIRQPGRLGISEDSCCSRNRHGTGLILWRLSVAASSRCSSRS
jgi:outer membrane biosynthesis protein TonB